MFEDEVERLQGLGDSPLHRTTALPLAFTVVFGTLAIVYYTCA
jgi:hypothetical protein